jgi:porphobilinogen deaminase
MAAPGGAPGVRHVVIGSRKSDLAMWQAREVKRLLEALPGTAGRFTFEIQTEIAKGDVVLDQHLAALAASQPGIFTKELEVGLQVRPAGGVGDAPNDV